MVQDLDTNEEFVLLKLKKLDFPDIDPLKKHYKNLNSLQRREIISKLEKKIDYALSWEKLEEKFKIPLIKDLVYCSKCGILPFNKEFKCLKCLMEDMKNINVTNLIEIEEIHMAEKNYEFCLYIFKTLLKLDKKLDISMKYLYYDNIGNAYNKLGNNEKALKYYNNVLTSSADYTGDNTLDINFKYNIYKKIGKIYYNLDEYQKALTYFNRAKLDDAKTYEYKLKTMNKLKEYLDAYFLIKEMPSFIRNRKNIKNLQNVVNDNLTPVQINTLKEFDDLLVKGLSALERKDYVNSLFDYKKALKIALKLDLRIEYKKILATTTFIQNQLLNNIIKTKKEVAEEEHKRKSLLKKVTKGASKMIGEVAGDLIEDKISDLTGNQNIGNIAGKVTKTGISQLKNAIAIPKDIEDSIKKPSKSKRFLKRASRGISKSVGKIAGEAIGDKISELTGNQDIGNIAGKIAKVGVSSLAKKTLEGIYDNSSSDISIDQTIQTTHVPISIDAKERLLGIIKTKKKVNIQYIEKFLKFPKEEIIGMIFDLVGSGQIKGEFNNDDSEFELA